MPGTGLKCRGASADSPGMNEILSWLAWSLGTLVLLAVAVAGWEHLVREAAGQRVDCGAHGDTGARALSVDVRLDTQAAALAADAPEPTHPPPTDRQNRLTAMAEALARAADPGRAPHDRGHWMDTTPRIVDLNEPALGAREGTHRKDSSQPG